MPPSKWRTRSERPLRDVPRVLMWLLAAALAAQFVMRHATPGSGREPSELPPAPSAQILRLMSLGETPAAARLSMLYLQSFDLHAANEVPYRDLDYDLLTRWLSAALETDPISEYPLFLSARIYAEVPDQDKTRRMLEFVHDRFLEDPNRRWPFLAHATLLAKYRLGDLATARRYASNLTRLTTDPRVPFWVREFEGFILEDMGELEAARIVLGGLVASDRIQDPEELRFLQLRLGNLEAQLKQKGAD